MSRKPYIPPAVVHKELSGLLLPDLSSLKVPVLTVELTAKWYTLFLVHPDLKVEEIFFPIHKVDVTNEFFPEPPNGPPYLDHVPNPAWVIRYAVVKEYEIDSLALELIVGRWELEKESSLELWK